LGDVLALEWSRSEHLVGLAGSVGPALRITGRVDVEDLLFSLVHVRGTRIFASHDGARQGVVLAVVHATALL